MNERLSPLIHLSPRDPQTQGTSAGSDVTMRAGDRRSEIDTALNSGRSAALWGHTLSLPYNRHAPSTMGSAYTEAGDRWDRCILSLSCIPCIRSGGALRSGQFRTIHRASAEADQPHSHRARSRRHPPVSVDHRTRPPRAGRQGAGPNAEERARSAMSVSLIFGYECYCTCCE